MCKQLRSVGLDVGTSTTQLILSELTVENEAGGFAVPKMQITGRRILYESPVYFTPLLGESLVDGQRIKQLVAREYAAAGIDPKTVDTGAVIITGETSRKENARAVLAEVAGFAGDFVVATAGPELESELAAKGAGACDYSARTGKSVLHMDIGGGTSNLAWIEDGRIVKTGCLNVGGRLVKFDDRGQVCYLSAVLRGLTDMAEGCVPSGPALAGLTQTLVQALEMAAGLREKTELLERLWTKECSMPDVWPAPAQVLSFSGGVAACMGKTAGEFGDIGPELAQAILRSRLCRGEYRIPEDAIRATVIGAGCHSAALSGSTVFCRGVRLPLKNLPVAVLSPEEQVSESLPKKLERILAGAESLPVVLALPGYAQPDYSQVAALADKLAALRWEGPMVICLETDMAKALGQRLCLLGAEQVLCLDGILLTQGCYLDVGAPVGPAYPVVVKTLVLSKS